MRRTTRRLLCSLDARTIGVCAALTCVCPQLGAQDAQPRAPAKSPPAAAAKQDERAADVPRASAAAAKQDKRAAEVPRASAAAAKQDKRAAEVPRALEPPLRAEEAAGRPMNTPELRLNPRTLASLDAPLSEQLPKIDGGAIPRVALSAELQRGVGAFLRQVRTKPAVQNGRFVGWRVIELFKKRPDVHVTGLKAGDTVLKVNGRSLERPEQFKLVWDSLANADELVIEIERQGRRCQLRYSII